ncbi:MAG: hypothetical protein ACI32N_10500 [Bulleidia sp.]
MPAKKTVTAAEETAAPKKRTCKRKTTTAAVEETTETAVKTTAKKTTAKKAATEAKTAEKKTTTRKTTAAKKTTTKKTTAKKAAPAVEAAPVVEEVKPEVVKRTVKDYEDIINWKKGEAQAMDWLYIEVNAGDLLTEVEAGVDNLSTTCQAILNCMLEGDGFIVDPAEEDKVNTSLTVRYYCDNLSPDRKKYFNN